MAFPQFQTDFPDLKFQMILKDSIIGKRVSTLPAVTKQKEAKGTKKINADHNQNAINHKGVKT